MPLSKSTNVVKCLLPTNELPQLFSQLRLALLAVIAAY
jgi:hypothetical protein